jgi:hypothetical protein
MIMLYPFVPGTMDRLRESLRLPPTVFRIDELGIAIPAGHAIGPKAIQAQRLKLRGSWATATRWARAMARPCRSRR